MKQDDSKNDVNIKDKSQASLDDILERVEKLEIDKNKKSSWKGQVLAVPNLIALFALGFGIFQYVTPDYTQIEINKRQLEVLSKQDEFWQNQRNLKDEFEVDSKLSSARLDIESVLRLFSNEIPFSHSDTTKLYSAIAQIEKWVEKSAVEKYQYYHLMAQAYNALTISSKARDSMEKAISAAIDENINLAIMRQLYLELLRYSTGTDTYEKKKFIEIENRAIALGDALTQNEKNIYLSQIFANSVVASMLNSDVVKFTKSSQILDKYPEPGKSQIRYFLQNFALKKYIKDKDFYSKIDKWIDIPDDYDVPRLPVNDEDSQSNGFFDPYNTQLLN